MFAAVEDEVTLFFLLACQTDRQRAEWGSEYLVPRDYHLPRVDTTIVLFGQVSSPKAAGQSRGDEEASIGMEDAATQVGAQTVPTDALPRTEARLRTQ